MPQPQTASTFDRRLREYRDITAECLRRLEKDVLPIHIAITDQKRQAFPSMHFHMHPEVFIQVHGSTQFRTPSEEFYLNPGEVCVVPRGVPHGEAAMDDAHGFRRMVIMYGMHQHFAAHMSVKLKGHSIGSTQTDTFSDPGKDRMLAYLNDVETMHLSSSRRKHHLVINLLRLNMQLMQDGLDQAKHKQVATEPDHSMKVAQCKDLVMTHLPDAKLNVKFLAQNLRCSPDYLSHKFYKETGQPLIRYIHQQRVNYATGLLADTTMNISEVAWASGFSDPGYFIRIFKRLTQFTPKQYRKHKLAPELASTTPRGSHG